MLNLNRLIGLYLAITIPLTGWGFGKLHTTKNEPTHVISFIAKNQDLALQQAQQHGIPASIKIAQSALETAWGQSELALDANNQFGIKGQFNGCGYSYKADQYRCYPSAKDSWEDHSQFLLAKSPIQKLVASGNKEYLSWTQTLENLHYAEDPLYREKLNDIIERTGLFYLDLMGEVEP